MRSARTSRAAGFTIIELMIVVAIVAILAVVAAPSFTDFLSKRRVDGTMSELVTDIYYARSEAVSRNETLRMTFGTDCYVIHRTLVPSFSATVATCTRNSKSITPPAAEIKTVQVDAGRPLTIDASALIAGPDMFFEFDPVRGTAINSAASASGAVSVRSTAGTPWQLSAVLTLMGRVETCNPSTTGYVSGYANC